MCHGRKQRAMSITAWSVYKCITAWIVHDSWVAQVEKLTRSNASQATQHSLSRIVRLAAQSCGLPECAACVLSGPECAVGAAGDCGEAATTPGAATTTQQLYLLHMHYTRSCTDSSRTLHSSFICFTYATQQLHTSQWVWCFRGRCMEWQDLSNS